MSSLKVLSYNIKALGNNYTKDRIDKICTKIINEAENLDVVVFQEVFSDDAQQELINQLPGYTFIPQRSGGVLIGVKKPKKIKTVENFEFQCLNNSDRLTSIPGIKYFSGAGQMGKGGIIVQINSENDEPMAYLTGLHTQAQYPNTNWVEAGILKRYAFFEENREDPKNLCIITLGNIAEAIRITKLASQNFNGPVIIAGDMNLYFDAIDHSVDSQDYYTSEIYYCNSDQGDKVTKQAIYRNLCEVMLQSKLSYKDNKPSFAPPQKKTTETPYYFDSVIGEAKGSLDLVAVLNNHSGEDNPIEVLSFIDDKTQYELSDHNPVRCTITEQEKNQSANVQDQSKSTTQPAKLDKLSVFFGLLAEENARIYHTWSLFSGEARIKALVLDRVLCQVIAKKFGRQSILAAIRNDDKNADTLIKEILTEKVKVNYKGDIVTHSTSQQGTEPTVEVSLLGIIATDRRYRVTKFIDAAAETSKKTLDEIRESSHVTRSLKRFKKEIECFNHPAEAIVNTP